MQPPPASPYGHPQPAAAYQQRLTQALADEERLGRRTSLIGLLRFFAFALTLLAVGAAYDGRGPRGPLWALGLASLVAFIALIVHHGTLYERLERLRLLAATNRIGLRRLDGGWAEEPPPPAPEPSQLPPYAVDLDLDGPSSLTALIDTTQTRYGQAALWRLLSHAAEPTDSAAARARQDAVRELGPLLDVRQSVEVAGRMMHRNPGPGQASASKKSDRTRPGEPDPEPLLRWAEEPPVLSRTPLLRWLALLPLLTMPVLAARIFLAEIPPALGIVTLLLMGLQGVALLFSATHITRLLNRVSSSEGALSAYGELLTLLCDAPLKAAANQALQERLRGDAKTDGKSSQGGPTPEQALTRLRSIYGMLELRHNPLVWFPINILLLWDLQFALRLERWQTKHGPRLRGWLEALGEFEACASLAHLSHDNPDWCWPELVDAPATATAEPLFSAEALAHPLLPFGRRRGNDVAIAAPGQALLVTGSNMSGKSTLLRAVGLMQVLAQAGAPVCAKRAQLPTLVLRTVVRVDDSLARGLSHFYAELRRLKEVVDAAGRRPDAPLLFLLDEILHGTNTRERELGARLTIRTLCQRQALGLVTTHDLSLATLEEETGGAVRNFHFTEVVKDGTLRFDYQLRPGPVKTTNALRLMRECGIAIDWSLVPEVSPGVSAG